MIERKAPLAIRAAVMAALVLLAPAPGGAQSPDLLSPSGSPSLFDRTFEQQEYQRQTRELPRRVERAERAAEGAREAAAAARRAERVPPLPPRQIAPLPTIRLEDERRERRLAERAADAERQRARQRRLRLFLDRSGQAGSASLQAELAGQRAAQTARTARGMDRLQAGAAAGRNTLGEPVDPSLGRPLIRMPSVGAE